jgi:roadblock/LC7 domain-containing protein
MTQTQRNAAIRELLKAHTARNTATKAVARKGLIAEGIYTKDGKLRAEYGGAGKRSKNAA